LRHGSPLEFVVDQLNKTKGPMQSFSKILARAIKKYIQDGKTSGEKCPDCESSLIYTEGCKKCANCSYSVCG
jgi:ribonucleoside-diphosphate reductase alpha chain